MAFIHLAVELEDGSVHVVTQSEDGNGLKGRPRRVFLTACQIPAADLLSFGKVWSKGRGGKILGIKEVDDRNQGPRSKFGKTLAAMIAEAKAAGPEIIDIYAYAVAAVERAQLCQSVGLTATDEPVEPAKRRVM